MFCSGHNTPWIWTFGNCQILLMCFTRYSSLKLSSPDQALNLPQQHFSFNIQIFLSFLQRCSLWRKSSCCRRRNYHFSHLRFISASLNSVRLRKDEKANHRVSDFFHHFLCCCFLTFFVCNLAFSILLRLFLHFCMFSSFSGSKSVIFEFGTIGWFCFWNETTTGFNRPVFP